MVRSLNGSRTNVHQGLDLSPRHHSQAGHPNTSPPPGLRVYPHIAGLPLTAPGLLPAFPAVTLCDVTCLGGAFCPPPPPHARVLPFIHICALPRTASGLGVSSLSQNSDGTLNVPDAEIPEGSITVNEDDAVIEVCLSLLAVGCPRPRAPLPTLPPSAPSDVRNVLERARERAE